jgi:hypothetical protein
VDTIDGRRERKTHHANFLLLINTYAWGEVSLEEILERWWTPPLGSWSWTSYCMRGDESPRQVVRFASHGGCTASLPNETRALPNVDTCSHDGQTRERTKPDDRDWLDPNCDHDGLVHCTHPSHSPDTSSNLFILLMSSSRYDVRLVIPWLSPATNRRKSATASARFTPHRHTQL